MLVDRLVTAVWRMQRVRYVESGEIAMNLEKTDQKSDEINPVSTLLKTAEAGGSGAGIKARYPSSCFTYFPARMVIFPPRQPVLVSTRISLPWSRKFDRPLF